MAELVRQGERLLEAQVEASRDQDEKNRHLATAAAGVIALAAAISTPLFGEDLGNWIWPFVILMAISFLAIVFAAVSLAQAYVGLGKNKNEFAISWEPAELQKSAEAKDSIERIHRSTLFGLQAWTQENKAQLGRTATRRRRAVLYLLVSVASLWLAYLYALVIASFPHA